MKLMCVWNNGKKAFWILVVLLWSVLLPAQIDAETNKQATNTKPKPVVFLVNGFQNCCVSGADELIDALRFMDVDQDSSRDLRFAGIDARSLDGTHYDHYVIPWNSLYNTQDGTSGYAGQGIIVKNPDKTTDKKFYQEVGDYINELDTDTPLIFVGHSFGADSIMNLLPQIDTDKHRILFVGTIDAVKGGGLRPTHSALTNVEYLFNRWQTNVPYPFDLWVSGEFICARSCNQTVQNYHKKADGTAIRVRCADYEVCDGAQVTLEQQCVHFLCTDLPAYDPGTKNKPVNHQSLALDEFVQKQMIDAIRNQVRKYKTNESITTSPNQWTALKQPHYNQIHMMPDGRVLGWNSQTGAYRLWDYSPSIDGLLTNPNGNPVSGTWSRLKQPNYDQIHVMVDGRVLGWNSRTGAYRLWGYNYKQNGLLVNPNGNEVSGQWIELTQPNYDQIDVMPDGRVLGWNSQTGDYRLWKYSLAVTDLLTSPDAVAGRWTVLRKQNYDQLHVLPDNRVLGWNSQTGAYRLWNYSPSVDGLLTNPNGNKVSGQWSDLKQPNYDQMVIRSDGAVIAWNSTTGISGLWQYDPTVDGLLTDHDSGGSSWTVFQRKHYDQVRLMSNGRVLAWNSQTGAYLYGYDSYGKWSVLKQPNYDQIHVMPDNHILGWNSQTGDYRLWQADRTVGSTSVNFTLVNPNGSKVSGKWSVLKHPNYDQIHVMPDNRVLGWNSQTGDYRLWNYSPSVDGLLSNP